MPGSHPGAERNGPRMDGIFHELSRKTDPAKLLGYLNFSDGRPDPKFQKGLADAVGVSARGRRGGPVGRDFALARPGARRTGVVRLARVPRHHAGPRGTSTRHSRDCPPRTARTTPTSSPTSRTPICSSRSSWPARCEAVLRQGAPWDEPDRLVAGALDATQRLRRLSTDRASSKRGRTPSTTHTRRCGPCRST